MKSFPDRQIKLLMYIIIAVIVLSGLILLGIQINKKQEANKIKEKKEKIESLQEEIRVLTEKGELGKTIEKYKELHLLDPENPSYWNTALWLDLASVNSSDDIQKIEETLKDEGNSPSFGIPKKMLLAETSFKKRNFQEAINYLEEAKSAIENSRFKSKEMKNELLSAVLAKESFFYLFLDEIEKAEEINNQSLTLAPDNSLAYYYKSKIILDKNNDISAALEAAKLSLNNFNVSSAYISHSYAGRKFVNSIILTNLGYLYLKNGNLELAEENIKKAIDLKSNEYFPDLNLLLAKIYLEKKDYKKTQDYLEKWRQEASEKDNSSYYYILSQLEISQNNLTEAKSNLDKALNILENPKSSAIAPTTPKSAEKQKELINKSLIEIAKKKS